MAPPPRSIRSCAARPMRPAGPRPGAAASSRTALGAVRELRAGMYGSAGRLDGEQHGEVGVLVDLVLRECTESPRRLGVGAASAWARRSSATPRRSSASVAEDSATASAALALSASWAATSAAVRATRSWSRARSRCTQATPAATTATTASAPTTVTTFPAARAARRCSFASAAARDSAR